MSIRNLLIATTILVQVAVTSSAQSVSEINSEILNIDTQIQEVDATLAMYDGGLIKTMAELRRESLLLSRNLLRNRVLAIEGGEAVEISVPAVEPDIDKANEILDEISAVRQRIEVANREAENAGGLVQALALSRVETEKLTMAQLQMAYYQARYGIYFPTSNSTTAVGNSTAPTNNLRGAEGNSGENGNELPWADERFPDVDYSLAPFVVAGSEENKSISGWWVIDNERAAIDDSLKVTAVNYSQYKSGGYAGLTALIARCSEGDTALIFIQDSYLLSDYRRNSFDISYRIDDLPAVQSRWTSLTSNKGAGLFGATAETFIRELYDADSLFIRLTEKNGERHDVLFDLNGGREAYEQVASACGWSTLSLSSDDFRTIQTLLNAGGFDVGTPDGVWGAGSQRGMKAFQASVGIPETGAPDRETLSRLGMN